MEDWKSVLYKSYVSTQQATSDVDVQKGFILANYPYYQSIIRRYVPPDTNSKIVDLACGHGSLLFCLRELGYSNLKGVDVSEEQVELAHAIGVSEVEKSTIDSFLSKVSDKFDVIFMMDILEHLERQELVDILIKVHNALNESGTLIIHVPNAEGIFGMRVRYGDLTHELSFTSKSMNQLLKSVGFKKVCAYEDKPIVHGFRSYVRSVLWYLLTLAPRLLLSAETGTRGSLLSQNILVVAKKA